MNIVIADDNDRMRQMIKNMLLNNFKEIHNIYECHNGQQAVSQFEKYSPDWTLLDIKMEPMNGLSAARMIKENTPKAKIIILTNYDEKWYREEAKKISIYAYVLKENLKELVTIIKDVI